MAPRSPTKRLISTLGLGWAIFVALALGLRYGVEAPTVTVIIDQSYCPPAQWQTSVIEPYADLYKKSRVNQRKIGQVIAVTAIEQTVLAKVPTPDELGNPFGQAPDSATLTVLQQQLPESVVLKCGR